jgi:CheY-like chemotaxis protein
MEGQTATILYVDDEQTALRLQRAVLELAGYKVLTAKSGSAGVQVFKSEPVQAVVLDYWMADMNGMQAAREIRKLNPAIPIIILSAYEELLDESLGVADRWIRKGEQEPQYLIACLKELIKSRTLLKQ